MNNLPVIPDLKDRLQSWATRNEISITGFANQVGYTYQRAWDILKGDALVSMETIGRIYIAYGCAAGNEIVGREDDHAKLPTTN
jgi:hypothetical protein